jgi:hypothetical protein
MKEYWLAVGLLLSSVPSIAQTAGITIPLNGFFIWNDKSNTVVVYRHQRTRSDVPIEVYDSTTGAKRTIDILADFPQATGVIVPNVAVGPGGTIVVLCRLLLLGSTDDNKVPLKELILSYGPSLKLEKVWDIAPYEPSAITVDAQGIVYALGIRYDEPADATYPLIVAYDANGRIKQTLLPRSTFPSTVKPANNSRKMGQTAITVTDDRIFVYLPSVYDVITMDKDGKILKRSDVHDVFQQLALENGYASFNVYEDDLSNTGDLWTQLVLRGPKDSKDSTTISQRHTILILRVTAAGQADVQNREENTNYSTRLMGVNSSNEPIIVNIHQDLQPAGTLKIGLH